MRALGVSSPGLLLAGLAVPEYSDPAFEVVARLLCSNFSPEPRSDKRVHFGLGSESPAQFIEIHWPSGTFQTPEKISCDPVLHIDEPSGAVPR